MLEIKLVSQADLFRLGFIVSVRTCVVLVAILACLFFICCSVLHRRAEEALVLVAILSCVFLVAILACMFLVSVRASLVFMRCSVLRRVAEKALFFPKILFFPC